MMQILDHLDATVFNESTSAKLTEMKEDAS